MLKPENRKDKERFKKLKKHEVERERPPEQATDVAAQEVKNLRKMEGRGKKQK
ncbi:MAG: hypothetical protein SFX18_12690 [Pirellulales bacterium]|nr:hypothetical protein [Pirellulales bacterium]